MDKDVKQALERDRTIDITTIGRKSGQPRRIEIWFHNIEGKLYITGRPGRRSWFANLKANPDFTFHLKESVQADLPAQARPILDEAERRQVLEKLLQKIGSQSDFEDWVASSPLIEITLAAE